jgi:Hemerythrin HHE cation binding domain
MVKIGLHLPSAGVSAKPRDMTSQFARVLESQSQLCDELELIADGLPDSIDVQICLRTAQKLLPTIKMAHEFEELVVFPILKIRIDQQGGLAATVERLRYEHWGDEEYALDVHHALREFARQRDSANVDSLAWMLRGFFDSMRRHIAFDREYLLPVLNELVTAQGRTEG